MTIPEAVQPVLQAAALGNGGDTFVLDMGEPLRIVDLAQDIIELSGLEVGKDVEIVFTGLRPGEKMCEDLFASGEVHERTRPAKIHVARREACGPLAPELIGQLCDGAEQGDIAEMMEILERVLPKLTMCEAAEKQCSGRVGAG